MEHEAVLNKINHMYNRLPTVQKKKNLDSLLSIVLKNVLGQNATDLVKAVASEDITHVKSRVWDTVNVCHLKDRGRSRKCVSV